MTTGLSPHPANRGALLSPRASSISASVTGGCLYGYAAGIIGGIQNGIVTDRYYPSASPSTQALLSGVLVASILLGAAAGSFTAVPIAHRFGRRFAFKIAGFLALGMSVSLALVPGYPLLVVARTMLGVSVGFVTALCPWYVTDAIPASNRGSTGTIFQICICAAILLAEIVNYAFHPVSSLPAGASQEEKRANAHIDEWKWRLQLGLAAIPAVAVIVVSFIMHESPVYLQELIEKQRSKGAEGRMEPVTSSSPLSAASPDTSPLLGSDASPSASAEPLLSSSPSPPASASAEAPVLSEGWTSLLASGNRKWIAVCFILSATQQLTGIHAITIYTPRIFMDAHLFSPLLLTIGVVGVWNLIWVSISFTLVDRFGRRGLMIFGLIGMSAGLGGVSAAYEFFPENKGPLAIVSLLLFIGSYECGPGPLFFLLAMESFPARLRNPALSLTSASAWVFAILTTFTFPEMDEGLGSSTAFLVLLGINAVLIPCTWWAVPAEGSRSTIDAETEAAAEKKHPAQLLDSHSLQVQQASDAHDGGAAFQHL